MEIKNRMFSNKNLLQLFFPLIIEQGLEYLIGLADSMMVASVSESAVSGVSLVDFVMSLLISIFSALATGGAVIIGQYMGRNEKEKACDTADQLIRFAVIFSLAITVLVYFFKQLILYNLFGTITDEVRMNANTYLMISALSIPFLAVYNVGAAIFRTMGNSKLPMKIMLVMNILHVLGNAVCVFGFHMGTAGVAFPTLISRVGAAIIIIILALNKKSDIYISKKISMAFNGELLKRILSIALPYGFENGLFNLGRIVVLSMIATFGTAAIAANSISGTITLFSALPGTAINLGFTVVISRCIGADDYEQAKYYIKKILMIVWGAMLVSGIIVIGILPFILKIYSLSNEATEMAYETIISCVICSIIIWPLGNSISVIFRAAGDVKFPMIISTASMIIVRIGFAYILSTWMGYGMIGTWIAVYLDWLVKGIIFAWRYFSGKWMTYKAI